MNDIVIRRMPFEWPDRIDPVFIAGDARESYQAIALSLLLPFLEPYLIRTMNEAKKHIDDPKLLDDLRRFNAQEGQHYKAHARFNAAVRLEGFEGLKALEEELDADYKRFTRTKSLRFNLAYAEGFEAFTMNVANFSFEHVKRDQDSPIAELMEWHLIEEFEHRTVAFDVYDRVCGGYFYRLLIGTYAQWHFLRWVGKVVRYMLRAQPPPTPSVPKTPGSSQHRGFRGRKM